jgi:hypothetical protein
MKRWMTDDVDTTTTDVERRSGRTAGATGDPKWCAACPEDKRARAVYRVGKKGFCFAHKAHAVELARKAS